MTGKRGPVSGTSYGQKPGTKPKRATKPVPIFSAVLTDTPPVPGHLGVVGKSIWNDVWQALPILSPQLDYYSVYQYCSAADDAVRARAALTERGLVIDEVVGDARGGSLGTRATLNPAEAALRRADKVLIELGDRLGLSPAARARLGLVLNQAALASAEASRLLDSMYAGDVIEGTST